MQASAPQSHLRYPLNRLIGNAGNLRALRVLIEVGAPMSVSQLAAATGLTPQGVRLVLRALSDLQAVEAFGSGRSQVFAAKVSHPLVPELRRLFGAERANWDRLRESLSGILASKRAISAAWYYGSVARGEDGPGSDIDLAVVVAGGRVDQVLASVRRALAPVEDEFGVTFSVSGLSPSAIAKHAADPRDGWWKSMLRDARVLKGPRPEELAPDLQSSRAA